MRLSTRGHYGLRAMAQLARTYGQGPVALSEVARSEGISLAYLEQIMAPLRRAGLVEASRGVRGGYELRRHPAEITAGDIVRVLEGPLVIAACAAEDGAEGVCERESVCATKNMWTRLRDSISEVLDSTSLADLGEEVPMLAQESPQLDEETVDG